MANDLSKATRWYFVAIALVFAWFIWGVSIAEASGDCRGKSCNHSGDLVDVDVHGGSFTDGDVTVNGGDVTVNPGDVTLNGGTNTASTGAVSNSTQFDSKALALSNGLGDVDIAGCLGSTQFATPLFSKQKLSLNWPCMAEFYLRHGKYDLAAMAICNTAIVKEFDDEAACELAHDFEPMIAEPSDMVRSAEEEHEQVIVEQQALINQQNEELNAVSQRLDQLEKQKPTTIVQKVGLTTEQRAALAEVFSK